MKKFALIATALFLLTGCGMDLNSNPATLPSAEATPNPNQQLVNTLTGAVNAAPSETVLSLLDGKEVRILSQVQGSLTDYLERLAKSYVREQFSGQVTAGEQRMGVDFRKANGGWQASTYSVSSVAQDQNFIQSIFSEMKDEFVKEHTELHNEFFYVQFRGNPEPYDAVSGESYLNQLFAQKGFATQIEISATLRGRDAKGEEKKIVKDYSISLLLSRK